MPVIIVEDNIITNKRGCLGPLWKSLLIEKLERGESIMIDHFTPCPEVTYMPIDEKLIYAAVSNKTVTISFVAQPRPMKSNASITKISPPYYQE
ncbi:hypothetical protein [Candidatus Tisiphia endosymbiont of Nemotelus uliginosus]|uniref:hypothetical protein n=1 Tax=Candidatus Tisiphia endosymbiont of Nemotelus uliginosus TaxID=3077926 RepID=UPI0035C92AC6